MVRLLIAFLLAGWFVFSSPAQSPVGGPASTQNTASSADSSYKLTLRTGLVIEDVSVTDGQGNAVTGLPQTAFHLQDDGTPQQIRSFGEQQGPETHHADALPAQTYSNAALYRNSGVVVALLVDGFSMGLPDQMYLRLQMHQFLKTMAPGTQVALFRTGRRGAPVLIQSLTTDRARLSEAIDGILPAIPQTLESGYSNAVAELENISEYLRPVPGRKALLWFGGQFPLFLDPSFCGLSPGVDITAAEHVLNCAQADENRKEAFRALQGARVAVYPIDVRGVLVLGGPNKPPVGGFKNSPGSVAPSSEAEFTKVAGAYDVMEQLAKATGGHAYYSNNALAAAMSSAVHLATGAYTLSYRPEPPSEDGKWHTVHLTVDGGYTVHYRTGYYAADAARPSKPRLTAEGRAAPSDPKAALASTTEADGFNNASILFRAQVRPESKGESRASRYIIDYSIPSDQLAFALGPDGTQHARLRLSVLAYNNQGDVLGDAIDVVETRFTPSQMALATRIGTPALQAIIPGKGSQFLLLAVEDIQTHRVGTLQIAIDTLRADIHPAR